MKYNKACLNDSTAHGWQRLAQRPRRLVWDMRDGPRQRLGRLASRRREVAVDAVEHPFRLAPALKATPDL